MQNIHLNNIQHIDKRKLKNVYSSSRNSGQLDEIRKDGNYRAFTKHKHIILSPQLDKSSNRDLIQTVDQSSPPLQHPQLQYYVHNKDLKKKHYAYPRVLK